MTPSVSKQDVNKQKLQSRHLGLRSSISGRFAYFDICWLNTFSNFTGRNVDDRRARKPDFTSDAPGRSQPARSIMCTNSVPPRDHRRIEVFGKAGWCTHWTTDIDTEALFNRLGHENTASFATRQVHDSGLGAQKRIAAR